MLIIHSFIESSFVLCSFLFYRHELLHREIVKSFGVVASDLVHY